MGEESKKNNDNNRLQIAEDQIDETEDRQQDNSLLGEEDDTENDNSVKLSNSNKNNVMDSFTIANHKEFLCDASHLMDEIDTDNDSCSLPVAEEWIESEEKKENEIIESCMTTHFQEHEYSLEDLQQSNSLLMDECEDNANECSLVVPPDYSCANKENSSQQAFQSNDKKSSEYTDKAFNCNNHCIMVIQDSFKELFF